MYQLKVNQQQTIVALRLQGWSKRRIARELGLDRATVRKYLVGISKPATNPHTGSAALGDALKVARELDAKVERLLASVTN